MSPSAPVLSAATPVDREEPETSGEDTSIHARLACPQCGARLRLEEPSAMTPVAWQCESHAEHRYESSSQGIPILLTPTEREQLASELESSEAASMRRDYKPSLTQRAIRLTKRVLGANKHLPPTARQKALHEGTDPECPAGPALVVGSGVKPRIPGFVNLEIAPFENVDIVGSALALPFQDNTFRYSYSAAVLEHVRDPQRMIAEMCRVTKPGGFVFIEVPFLQHFHAYPNDYQRYTVEGLKALFDGFEVIETGVCVGPGSALTAMAGDYIELLTFSKKRWVNDIVRCIPLALLWPLKFLDPFLVKHQPRSHELASGIHILARKPLDAAAAAES